jgi:hypothetical protein
MASRLGLKAEREDIEVERSFQKLGPRTVRASASRHGLFAIFDLLRQESRRRREARGREHARVLHGVEARWGHAHREAAVGRGSTVDEID